jgi:hypothetical protein
MSDMATMQQKLSEAYEDFQAACQKEDTARRERTACLNNLNEAQREFDKALTEFKAQHSGRDTDWHMQRHCKTGVSA